MVTIVWQRHFLLASLCFLGNYDWASNTLTDCEKVQALMESIQETGLRSLVSPFSLLQISKQFHRRLFTRYQACRGLSSFSQISLLALLKICCGMLFIYFLPCRVPLLVWGIRGKAVSFDLGLTYLAWISDGMLRLQSCQGIFLGERFVKCALICKFVCIRLQILFCQAIWIWLWICLGLGLCWHTLLPIAHMLLPYVILNLGFITSAQSRGTIIDNRLGALFDRRRCKICSVMQLCILKCS